MRKFPLPRTLHMRIMVAMAMLQFVVVGLFSVYMLVQLVEHEATSRQVLGHKVLTLTAPAVERMIADQDVGQISPYLDRLLSDAAISSITLKSAGGTVLYSRTKPDTAAHSFTQWFSAAQLGTSLTTAVGSSTDPLGLLSIGLSNEPINEDIRTLLQNVLYLFLILLALDLLASELLIKYFVAPLGPLTAMAMGVSRGDLDTSRAPATDRASDEVRTLTAAFVDSAKRMRDQIGELKATRSQLAEKELRLRNLVNNMQEVLLEMDRAGRILFLNPIWETLTGYRVDETIGQPFSAFLVQPAQQAYFTEDRLERIPQFDLQLELRAADGESIWVQMNTAPQEKDGQFAGIVSTLVDITENLHLQQLQRAHEHDLYTLSITDPLTSVFNRRHFDQLLGDLLQTALPEGRQVALLIVDIDGFKFINDTYGHPVGDEVLKAVAKTLSMNARDGSIVARIAGDEFAVVMENASEEYAMTVARALHREIGAANVHLAVGQLHIQTSVGIAVAPLHGKTPQDLVRAADVALYHAKKSGRNRVDALSQDVGEAIMDIFSQGFELRNALSAGMISPFMQPIVDVVTGEVFAYEVLTRLKRGAHYVTAEEFIVVAEELGLVRDMDLFVIQRALAIAPDDSHLFLNISLNSFYAPEFSQQLRALLLSPQGRRHRITIEFTERQTTAMTEPFREFFGELRDAGCRIALDDFGVGYSSYGFLRQLKPDYIKIDGSFVQQIVKSPQDAKIVQQIKELSVAFGALVIAEHVEDAPTHQMLRAMGVQYAQGYHFGRPREMGGYLPGQEVTV